MILLYKSQIKEIILIKCTISYQIPPKIVISSVADEKHYFITGIEKELTKLKN